MAFGYQFSNDPSMQMPMLTPQAGGGGLKPMGGDAMGAVGKAIGGRIKAGQAGSGATDVGFDGGGGATVTPGDQTMGGAAMGAGSAASASMAGPGQNLAGDFGNASRAASTQPMVGVAASPTVQAPMATPAAPGPTPMGYSAADMGAQAWQPRSAVGPRPFGY